MRKFLCFLTIIALIVSARLAHAAEAPEKIEAPVIRILEIKHGEVIISAGKDAGIQKGQTFETRRGARQGERHAVGGMVTSGVLKVLEVGETQSRASTHRNDRISTDDVLVGPLSFESGNLILPGRPEGHAEVGMLFRPIFDTTSGSNFAAIMELWGDVRLNRPVSFGVRMLPLGVSSGSNGGAAGTLLAEGGLDLRSLGLSLGLGTSFATGDMSILLYGGDPANPPSGSEARLAFSQSVRFGPRDGLNISGTNVLVFCEGDLDSELMTGWGGFTAQIEFPVHRRVDVIAQTGYSHLGWFYVDTGVFIWVRGLGDAGSIGITATFGYAQMETNTNDDYECDFYGSYCDPQTQVVSGPAVALGLTWRFGAF